MASTSEITVTFPGGRRVDAAVGAHVVRTDQPRDNGGEDGAPAPFDLFLASVATCAGIYVLGFCQKRGLPSDGIRLRQRMRYDAETRALTGVDIDIEVPPTVPEKYHQALVRVADQCAVKRAIAAPPTFQVRTAVAP